MEALARIAQDVSSAHWWVSVFLVGILINLASPRVDRWLTGWLAERSERVRKHRAGELARYKDSVARLMVCPELVAFTAVQAQTEQISARWQIVFGTALMGWPYLGDLVGFFAMVVMPLVGFVFAYYGVLGYRRARRNWEIASDAAFHLRRRAGAAIPTEPLRTPEQ